MNAQALKAALVRLAYISLGRDPDPAGEAGWIGAMADDLSNAEAIITQIEDSAEGKRRAAVLNGLVANANQQLDTLKSLLG